MTRWRSRKPGGHQRVTLLGLETPHRQRLRRFLPRAYSEHPELAISPGRLPGKPISSTPLYPVSGNCGVPQKLPSRSRQSSRSGPRGETHRRRQVYRSLCKRHRVHRPRYHLKKGVARRTRPSSPPVRKPTTSPYSTPFNAPSQRTQQRENNPGGRARESNHSQVTRGSRGQQSRQS